MRKNLLPLSLACITVIFGLFPFLKAASKNAKADHPVTTITATTAVTEEKKDVITAKAASKLLFDSLKLKRLGLSQEALEYAYTGYRQLLNKGALKNIDVLTICDFSQSSFKKRMYIIDVTNFKVLYNTYVAHGKNTGLQYAKSFSNTPESLASSLGFYVTKHTYTGKHGLSLRLAGKEKGFNNNAEDRAIVVHGADYIGDHRLNSPYMGRSFGCPAVPQAQAAKVINYIKEGTCFFIYHPSENYLNNSKILNG